jgi:hypothetical protein
MPSWILRLWIQSSSFITVLLKSRNLDLSPASSNFSKPWLEDRAQVNSNKRTQMHGQPSLASAAGQVYTFFGAATRIQESSSLLASFSEWGEWQCGPHPSKPHVLILVPHTHLLNRGTCDACTADSCTALDRRDLHRWDQVWTPFTIRFVSRHQHPTFPPKNAKIRCIGGLWHVLRTPSSLPNPSHSKRKHTLTSL